MLLGALLADGRTHLRRQGGRAFTLIELLVVVGIILVVAGIILPVVAAATERGRSSACLSNLRQLYQAFDLYSSDHDGYVPPFQDRGAGKPKEQAVLLIASLAPYTRSDRIWFCPTDPFAGTPSTVGTVRHFYTSYGTSLIASVAPWRVFPMTMDGPVLRGAKTAYWRQPHPSEADLLTDCLWPAHSLPSGVQPPYSHLGSFNWLYFDGHAKSLSW